MKKLLVVCFGIASLIANAQYIDLQLGIALPSGSFGNNNFTNNQDAFATNGLTKGIQASYLIYQNLGLLVNVGNSTFGFNEASYEQQFNKTIVAGTSVKVKSNKNYTVTQALAGGYVKLGKHKFTTDIKFLIGFLTLTNYGLTYTSQFGGQETTQKDFTQTDASIAFGWGITSRYRLPKDFCISLNLDNISANTSFNPNGYSSNNSQTVSKPFQAYLLSLGIGYFIQ